MIWSLKTLHQHVVHVHLHISSNLGLEDLIDETLISNSDIFQTERYYFIAVYTFVGYKSCGFLIFWYHPDLIIPDKSIHETQKSMTWSRINQLINLRQREAVLRTSLIQIRIVDANSLLSISFFHHYHIGEPFRIYSFSDEACCEELVDFFINNLFVFQG